MKHLRYLAYGSNLHPGRLHRRVPSAELETVIRLPGWRLTFHKRGYDGSGKGHIVCTEHGNDHVWCAVYRFPAAERGPLDEAERGYGITELALPDGSRAFTYLALPERLDTRAVPYDWYRDLIALGARYLGAPEPYAAAIERHPALMDPDPERSGHNRSLLAELARISHHPSTADADSLAVTGRAPSSRLDVVSATPAPSSGPRAPSQRRLDALATNDGEICGPLSFNRGKPER